jgi:hypothetical protein
MSDGNGISTMASSRPKNKNFDDVDVEQNAEEIRETRVAAGNPRYLAALIVIIGLLVSLAFILVGSKGRKTIKICSLNGRQRSLSAPLKRHGTTTK